MYTYTHTHTCTYYSDQKAIDVENRANYHALRQRWHVLDKTVRIPDDDVLQSPPYMEFSDDETDDSNCSPPPPSVKPNSDSTTPQSNGLTSKANGAANDNLREIERKLESSSLSSTKCASCGGRTSGSDSGNCSLIGSLGESMDSTVVDDTSNLPSEAQSKYCSSCLNQLCAHQGTDRTNCSSESGCCGAVEKILTGEEDRIFCVRVMPRDSSLMVKNSESKTRCECNHRRGSCGEVLDDEGQALIKILEFPSQVSTNLYTQVPSQFVELCTYCSCVFMYVHV